LKDPLITSIRIKKTFPPPALLRAKGGNSLPGAYKALMERVVVYTLKEAHWIGSLKFYWCL
jgi:hypothetical protein